MSDSFVVMILLLLLLNSVGWAVGSVSHELVVVEIPILFAYPTVHTHQLTERLCLQL